MDLNVISHVERAARDPRVFDGAELPADPAVLARLVARTVDADLAAPPVVLPDFHHKSNMEMPSSWRSRRSARSGRR